MKNSETSALCTSKFGCQIISSVSLDLPSQSQPPGPDSAAGITISRGAKFDVLICVAIRHRKDLLHPFIEPLGKRFQVLGGVEFRMFQFLWLRLSDLSVNGMVEHTFDHFCCSHCNELSALDQASNECYQTGKPVVMMNLTHTWFRTTLRPVAANCQEPCKC